MSFSRRAIDFIKGIKHAERIGNIGMCRVLLARLKNVSMDRSWRSAFPFKRVRVGGKVRARVKVKVRARARTSARVRVKVKTGMGEVVG